MGFYQQKGLIEAEKGQRKTANKKGIVMKVGIKDGDPLQPSLKHVQWVMKTSCEPDRLKQLLPSSSLLELSQPQLRTTRTFPFTVRQLAIDRIRRNRDMLEEKTILLCFYFHLLYALF